MSLTDKQRLFVLFYLQDMNATKAALKAGYSEDTAYKIGAENLRKPQIRAAIEAKLAEAEITTFRVLGELTKVAYSDLSDYVDIEDETGSMRAKGYGEMEPGASRAIKKVKEKRVILQKNNKDKTEDIILESTTEFELHDKLKALELIGRYLGAFNDKLKLQGDPEKPLNMKMDIGKATVEEVMDFIRKKTHGE